MPSFTADFRTVFTYVENALAAFSDHEGQAANRTRDALNATLSTLQDVAEEVVRVSTDINDVSDLIGNRTDPTPTVQQVYANQSGIATAGVPENTGNTGSPADPWNQVLDAVQGLTQHIAHVEDRLSALELSREQDVPADVPDATVVPDGVPQDPPPGVVVDPAPPVQTSGSPGDSTPGAGV